MSDRRDWVFRISMAVAAGIVAANIAFIVCNFVVLEAKTYNAKGTFVETRYCSRSGNRESYISAIKVDQEVYEVDSRDIYYYCLDLEKGADVDVVMESAKHPLFGWETSVVEVDGKE